VFGPRAVRADIAARVRERLAVPDLLAAGAEDRARDTPSDAEVASWLGCTTREVRRVVDALTARAR